MNFSFLSVISIAFKGSMLACFTSLAGQHNFPIEEEDFHNWNFTDSDWKTAILHNIKSDWMATSMIILSAFLWHEVFFTSIVFLNCEAFCLCSASICCSIWNDTFRPGYLYLTCLVCASMCRLVAHPFSDFSLLFSEFFKFLRFLSHALCQL